VGVIQREIERAGVATVSISLVREFTEKVRPPRALWVPFPFGRPFGAPRNVKVQRQVLVRALSLLAAPSGPVLEEFTLDPEDERLHARHQALGRRCGPAGCSLDDLAEDDETAHAEPVETPYGGNLQGVLNEISVLQPAHWRYREQRNGRTAVGASGSTPERIADAARAIHAFIKGEPVRGPGAELPERMQKLSESLFVRLLIDDLKAYYMESRVELAADETADASRVNDWFWLNTWAGRMVIAARDRFVATTDRKTDPNWIVARAIVPRGYGKSSYTLGHVVKQE